MIRQIIYAVLGTCFLSFAVSAATPQAHIDPNYPKSDLPKNGDNLSIIGVDEYGSTITVDEQSITGVAPNYSGLMILVGHDNSMIVSRVDVNCQKKTFIIVDEAAIDSHDVVKESAVNSNHTPAPIGDSKTIDYAVSKIICAGPPPPRYDKYGDLNQPYQPKIAI